MRSVMPSMPSALDAKVDVRSRIWQGRDVAIFFSFLFHTRQAAHQQLSLMQSTVGGIIAPHLSRLCLLNDVLIKRPKCARFYRNVSVNKATSNKHGRQTLQFTAITPIEYRRKKESFSILLDSVESLSQSAFFQKKEKLVFLFLKKYLRLQFVWLWAYIESLYVFFFLKNFFIILLLFYSCWLAMCMYMTPEASLTGGDVLGQPQNFSRNHYLMGLF